MKTPNEIFFIIVGEGGKGRKKKSSEVVGNQSRKGIRERKRVIGSREES